MPANRRGSAPRPLLFAIIAILIFGGSGYLWYAGNLSSAQNDTEISEPVAERNTVRWETRSFNEISVSAPFSFAPNPSIVEQLPEAVRNAVEYWEVYDGGDPRKFQASVIRIKFKSNISPSLEGAVDGAIRQVAAAAGDLDPEFTSRSIAIDEVPGRRVAYKNLSNGQNLHYDATLLCDGQCLWQIQVVHAGGSLQNDAEQVLGSIRIAKKTQAAE